MSLNDLLNSMANLTERSREVPSSPPLETVAFFVRWSRGLKNWKVSTLADYAGVSVSTVERVERGEKVSAENLDRIAVALGYETGKLHAPRIPLGADKATEDLIETYGYLEQVSVVPLKTQKAIRDAAKCAGILVHKHAVPEVHDDGIANLVEWIDLAGFILSENVERDGQEPKRRRLYRDIQDHVTEMERQGLTVLVGVMVVLSHCLTCGRMESARWISGELQRGHPPLGSRGLAKGSDLGSGAIRFGKNEMVSDG